MYTHETTLNVTINLDKTDLYRLFKQFIYDRAFNYMGIDRPKDVIIQDLLTDADNQLYGKSDKGDVYLLSMQDNREIATLLASLFILMPGRKPLVYQPPTPEQMAATYKIIDDWK